MAFRCVRVSDENGHARRPGVDGAAVCPAGERPGTSTRSPAPNGGLRTRAAPAGTGTAPATPSPAPRRPGHRSASGHEGDPRQRIRDDERHDENRHPEPQPPGRVIHARKMPLRMRSGRATSGVLRGTGSRPVRAWRGALPHPRGGRGSTAPHGAGSAAWSGPGSRGAARARRWSPTPGNTTRTRGSSGWSCATGSAPTRLGLLGVTLRAERASASRSVGCGRSRGH